MGSDNFHLPPGFHFNPTDEELVVHFLHRRSCLLPCNLDLIPDIAIRLVDPWELQGKALAGNNSHWYFITQSDQSHTSPSGYWVPIGDDELVVTSGSRRPVGTKKILVFYIGEAPAGTKTNWLMHEYRLLESRTRRNRSSKRKSAEKTVTKREWVLCRVYDGDSSNVQGGLYEEATELSCLDEVFLSLDDLDEVSMPNF